MSSIKYYTGVGSRKVPDDIVSKIHIISQLLDSKGYRVRSGGADGCDLAFENGVSSDNKDIYLPWKGFNDNLSNLVVDKMGNIGVAQTILLDTINVHHYNRMSFGAKKLHTRNVYQVLGTSLDNPSDFLICYTEGGLVKGGTATAIKLAIKNDVPVYNLGLDGTYENLLQMIQGFDNE